MGEKQEAEHVDMEQKAHKGGSCKYEGKAGGCTVAAEQMAHMKEAMMTRDQQETACIALEQRARVCDEEIIAKLKVIKELKPVAVAVKKNTR